MADPRENPTYKRLYDLLLQKHITEGVDLGGDPVWIDELMDAIWPEIEKLLELEHERGLLDAAANRVFDD